MRLLCAFLIALACIDGTFGDGSICTLKPTDIPKEWLDMVKPCIEVMEAQVKVEIGAAMKYLAMGAHFARDTINRPGFSKFFFESASEEREHAIKIIEYLLMRGQLTDNVSKLLQFPLVGNDTNSMREEWNSAEGALADALKLEVVVTRSIHKIIKSCENEPSFNDYHLVDYLAGEFLEEQYKGQRDLAGKISVLGKMMQEHGSLGEFLFDKKLLDGKV